MALCISTMPMVAFAAVQVSDPAFYARYSFLRLLEADDTLTLSDEDFFDEAAKVIFPVNQYRLPEGNALLTELEKTIIPQINADSLQLVRMVFRGAASPDGPVEGNRRLGQQRVASLFDFVVSRLAFPVADSLLSVDAVIEDYHSLCLMMRRANDPDYAIVQQLCDQYLDEDLAVLKRELQQAKRGQLWRRLLTTYFPQLRTARFVMVLRKYKTIDIKPVEPAPTVETVATVVVDTLPDATSIIDVAPPTAHIVQEDTLPRRELLSIKTNLLFYGLYLPGYDRWAPIPNVAIEYYPKGGHVTLGASFDMPWWQHYHKHKFFQFRNYQVEGRYYLRSSSQPSPLTSQPSPVFSGFYLSAYGHAGLFGICFDADRGWVGEGAGAGLGFGYVTPISKNGHWRLEFGLQAGFFRCKYDPYQYENPIDPAYHDDLYYYKWTLDASLFKKRQYRFNWIGPTRIGITLTYDLLYRRIQKKGASFKAKEILNIED